MNIVAVSTDPEYITVEATEGGGIDLTLESARMQVAGDDLNRTATGGSIQLQLLPADVEVITSRLAEIVTGLGFSVERAQQQQHSLDVNRTQYEWVVEFRQDVQGFTKTKVVNATDDRQARELAFFALTGDGYEIAKFNVIRCQRGHEVGTAR